MPGTYNVYGIGNALVDVQYQVDDAYLTAHSVVKGGMTLVDEARQAELVSGIAGNPTKRSSGGSAANTMIGVAQLGGTAYYGCLVGRDEQGDFYLDDLEAAGVKANPTNRGDGVTGTCLVLITPDAERSMNTFLGITGAFGKDQVEEGVIAESQYVYIEGYLLSSDTGHEAAAHAQSLAHRAGVPVALTLSDGFIIDVFRERIDALIGAGVDLLFCNAGEAAAYTGQPDTASACSALGRMVGGYAVTDGARGAIVTDGGNVFDVPGFEAKAVDTNGAGDSFAGAYLYGVTNGLTVAESAKLANYCAARVVSAYGPRLERALDETVEDILAM